ncbi:10873_t:CDS:1, partial [Gigaspora rosea]
MCLQQMHGPDAAENCEFADYLLRIGESKEPIYPNIGQDYIRLPDDIVLCGDLQELITHTYGDLTTRYNDHQYILERAIFTTKNWSVDEINDKILSNFPGEAKTYCSADSIVDPESLNSSLYLSEFLNTLSPNGVPPHKLVLKKNVPVIFLRNLNAKKGLYNGTCLIIRDFQQHFLDVEIVTGSCAGQRVFIPRIILEPSDTESHL